MEDHSKSVSAKSWIRDRIMFIAVIIFVFGASAYISADMFLDKHNMWLHPIKEFSLLISMIGVVSLAYELFLRELTFNEYKLALQEIVNPDAIRLGITGIYKDRSELGRAQSFDKLFKNVQHEIYIGGTSLLSISTSSRDLLKTKVLEGKTIKLLLMDPDSPVVGLITRQGTGQPTFRNEIKTSLLLLEKLKYEIDRISHSSKKGEFLVHTYQQIPSHSFISIDTKEPGGLIVADIGPYLGRSTPRPSMIVVNKKNGLFGYWKEMNDIMWENSKPFESVDDDHLGSKTKTVVIASGTDTEFYDTQKEDWKPSAICQMKDSWKNIKGGQWIWIKESLSIEEAKTGTQNKFRINFDLPMTSASSIVRADLFLRGDDVCRVTVNDIGLNQEFGGAEFPDPFIVDIVKYLKSGKNTLQFELISFAHPEASNPEDNPTGLIFRLDMEYSE